MKNENSLNKKFHIVSYFQKNSGSVQNLITYNFHFTSLVPLHLISNWKNLDFMGFRSSQLNQRYPAIKQSYLILTWLTYMSSFTSKDSHRSVSFSSLPIKLKKYTVVKAPMAHKTNSKEQYGFRFFFFKGSFSSRVSRNSALSSVNIGLLFALNMKKSFPVFSTNMLFLKSYTIRFHFYDKIFFNYFQYTKPRKKLN